DGEQRGPKNAAEEQRFLPGFLHTKQRREHARRQHQEGQPRCCFSKGGHHHEPCQMHVSPHCYVVTWWRPIGQGQGHGQETAPPRCHFSSTVTLRILPVNRLGSPGR